MCGLAGIIYEKMERRQEDLSFLNWLFINLMIMSEKRGPYATGMGWIGGDGLHSVLKKPVPASKFVFEEDFINVMAGVGNETTWLAGHTRWPTQGSHLDNINNHPVVLDVIMKARGVADGALVGCHNGHIGNASDLFERLNLPRTTDVDSEIIFAMAVASMRSGQICIPAFKKKLAMCHGQMSAVLASTTDPETVIVIKGNRPLDLRYSPEYNAVIYASDPRYLDAALPPETGWRKMPTPPMSIMIFRRSDIPRFEIEPFRLARL